MNVKIIGCSGGTTSQYGACASVLVRAQGLSLLLDCGGGTSLKLDEFNIGDNLDAVMISHFHFDHYSDAGILMHKRLIDWKNHPQPLMFYGLDDAHLYELRWLPFSNVTAISAKEKLRIGPFEIDCFATTHPLNALGFAIHYDGLTMVYGGDGALSDALIQSAQGCDLLICECSLYPDVDGSKPGHMNAYDFARLCELAKPQKAIATHLPIYGDHQRLLKQIRAKTTTDVALAIQGMEIEISCNY